MSNLPDSTTDSESVVVSMSASRELMAQFDDVVNLRGYHSRSQALRDAITDFLRKYRIQSEPGSLGMVVILVKVIDTVSFDTGLSRALLVDADLDAICISRSINEDSHIRTILVNGNLSGISDLIGRIRAIRGASTVEFAILPL